MIDALLAAIFGGILLVVGVVLFALWIVLGIGIAISINPPIIGILLALFYYSSSIIFIDMIT